MTGETAILPMPRRRLLWVVAPLGVLAIAGLTHLLVEANVSRVLSEDAAARGKAWAAHFTGEAAAVDKALQMGTLEPRHRDFAVLAAQAGGVAELWLYDARGRLAFRSSRPNETAVKTVLRDHEAGAVKVIAGSRLVVEVLGADRDRNLQEGYSKAFFPLQTADGEVRGVLAVSFDHSRAMASLRETYWSTALSAGGLMASLLLMVTVLTMRSTKTSEPEALAVTLVESQAEPAAERQGDGNFDDWIAAIAEDAAQSIPERIGLECHLGLGSAVIPDDASQVEGTIRKLIANAAAALSAEQGGNGKTIIFMPRIIVATAFTRRGMQVSVSDNRLIGGSTEDCGAVGQGLPQLGQCHVETPVLAQGSRVTLWWPPAAGQAKAA